LLIFDVLWQAKVVLDGVQSGSSAENATHGIKKMVASVYSIVLGNPNPAQLEPNRTWKSEVFQKGFEPAWIQGAEAPDKNFLPAKSRISP